jgi:ribose/xylose/arabinose/galactoside ABC-type transport system permease subunit
MTLVILVGQIDISIGSHFAVCQPRREVCLAKDGIRCRLGGRGVFLIGSLMGALNGALIGRLRLPSVIVTLAMPGAVARWPSDG